MTGSDAPYPSSELLALAAQYLDDQVGLAELTNWLVDHIDWLINGPNDEVRRIAEIVEFHLSEMSVFRSSEETLRQSLETSRASLQD